MTCHRFTAPGRMTNYELANVRQEHEQNQVVRYATCDRGRRRVRYMFMWSDLSQPNHPKNKEEWDRHMEDLRRKEDDE
jgi:hypothetical protein